MIRLEVWSGEQASERLEDVMTVYAEAFLDVYEPDPRRARRERRFHVAGHLTRPALRFVAALDDTDELVGMTYGVRGEAGHWWHDVITRALSADEAEQWMGDVWEIVELHVRPPWQGQGIGRALLHESLALADCRTAALSALDLPDLPARKLYAAEGFWPILSNFLFPGGATPYAVLVKELK